MVFNLLMTPKSHIYYYSKSNFNNHHANHIMFHLSNCHCNFLINRHLIGNLYLIDIYHHFNLQFNAHNSLRNYLLHIYLISKSCFYNHPHYCITSYHLNFHCKNYYYKNQRNIRHLFYISHHFKLM